MCHGIREGCEFPGPANSSPGWFCCSPGSPPGESDPNEYPEEPDRCGVRLHPFARRWGLIRVRLDLEFARPRFGFAWIFVGCPIRPAEIQANSKTIQANGSPVRGIRTPLLAICFYPRCTRTPTTLLPAYCRAPARRPQCRRCSGTPGIKTLRLFPITYTEQLQTNSGVLTRIPYIAAVQLVNTHARI